MLTIIPFAICGFLAIGPIGPAAVVKLCAGIAAMFYAHLCWVPLIDWGKSWGPRVAIAVCGLGLAVSLCTFVQRGLSDFGVAPFVLVLVMVALIRVQRRWATLPVELTADVFA